MKNILALIAHPDDLEIMAGGFIGSHLTELLLDKEYKVRALAQYNSFNYRGWVEDLPSNTNLEIVTGDVRDPHFCKEIVKGMDIVFHLAALIAIPYSYVAPDIYVIKSNAVRYQEPHRESYQNTKRSEKKLSNQINPSTHQRINPK